MITEIKNLAKTAKRIIKAIKNQERIILYGDADLDGVCAVIILQETIQTLGGTITSLYFPDRERDGYGITKKAVEELKSFAPALLVAMDLGISNFEEISLARALGFEVILVDHHEVLDRLPRAHIIIDPKQPGDVYSFKGFAACGLSFKLAEKILGKGISPSLRASLQELAALGTIADMMPREKDNAILIAEGLSNLKNSWRPGVQAFLSLKESSQGKNREDVIMQMISTLNVRDVQNGMPACFRLLTCPSEKKAQAMVEDLKEKNIIRKERIQQLAEQVRKKISIQNSLPLIFEGGSSFDYILLGAVASIIARTYGKPTFLYKKNEEESIGSVRAPMGFATVDAMKQCSPLLDTYGGHQQASGFRIKNENLEKFKQCLIQFFDTF